MNEKEGGHPFRRGKEELRGRRFQQYTPLNTNWARILQEVMAAEIIPPPRKEKTPERADHNKHCQYHKNHGHQTEECVALKDRIEELIQAGQLKRFIKDGRMMMRQSPEQELRGREYVEMREERPERRDNKKIERNNERREGRVERRNERSYHSPQRRRRSRE